MSEARSLTSVSSSIIAVSASSIMTAALHHAAVGENVPRSELAQLENKLLEEARKECLAQHYTEALALFQHALAAAEKSKSVNSDPSNRGTIIHNIAFCYHCMGDFDAAKELYEQCLDCFKAINLPLHQKVLNGFLYPERLVFELVYGGLNHNRVQMTKERLLDISFNRKPDLKQLDQYGRTKAMPDDAAAATDAAAASEQRSPAHPNAAPRWLSVPQEAAEATPPEAAATSEAPAAAAEEEAARKEWLEYYLKTGEWDQAAELVVTAEEREDLEYLRSRDS